MRRHNVRFLSFAVAAAAASVYVLPASAAQVNDTYIDVYKSNPAKDFISGSGIQGDRFVVDSEPALAGATNLSVALKPRNRDVPGEPDFVAGNVYTVQAGSSTSNPARPEAVIDFQFSPGADATSNYQLRLSVDFDPGAGTAYSVVQAPIHGGATPWDASDGYFLNGTGGNLYNSGWNDASVPYVISNTTNLSFLTAPPGFTYDRNAFGDYDVKLEVLDPTGTNVLASANAVAHVVPEPSNLLLLGIGGAGTLLRRRRRVA